MKKMMKDELTVKDAVHKIQLSLLEGIRHENQLSAATSMISQSDYRDVVTERSIANMCGYPLCSNHLPSERPWKGHYRISLKEHKVYDLQETYMFCSTSCLISSQAFAGNLQEERSSTLNPVMLNQVLKLFDGLSLDSTVNMGKNGDLGLSKLKIQEKTYTESGEVSLEEWIGPSNAIDGYVPRRDHNLKSQQPDDLKKGAGEENIESSHSPAQPSVAGSLYEDLKFESVIITQDEYCISKTSPPVKANEPKGKPSSKDARHREVSVQRSAAPSQDIQERRSVKYNEHKNVTTVNDKLNILEDAPGPSQKDATKAGKEHYVEQESALGSTLLKSSLKTSDSKKATRSVTWADDKIGGDQLKLCECRDLEDYKGAEVTSQCAEKEVDDESNGSASAEVCARALSQAAEAVASGKSDVSEALAEAGLMILPPHGLDEIKSQENGDVMDTDAVLLKWPPKPGFSNADLFDSEDSWYDSPPDGFHLTLSPFSAMFMALFTWISSSSLAYIYGRDECSHEEYLSVNGREYPQKIVISDGLSSEIKQTLAGCLARALPGLVGELRLPIPISTLEQGMGRLLDTMSFTDPLPGFGMKQWQVMILLFLDALSVIRIPALTPYMMGRRILLPKVLEGAHISAEEFEIMKDLIIPLGRVPQFSTQSGG